MASYKKLLAQEKPAMQIRVRERVAQAGVKVAISQLYDTLNAARNKPGECIETKLPSATRTILHDCDPPFSVLKQHVVSLGGKLRLEVILPTGKRVLLDL